MGEALQPNGNHGPRDWFIISRVGLDTAALRELNTDLLTPNFALFVASSLLLMIGYAISAANWAYTVSYTHLTLPTICSV